MIKRYTLKRIRLVNFHNFLDETIDLNGHLFLLGGNGSGKTTVLDAVHFVLTAGRHHMELNSAARMADQPRNLGRTLQGIFLRYDLEKGQRNEDKTIGYAALEFEKPNSGERFCIGCGALATTMQAVPIIWGFEAATSLDKLALTVTRDGQKFPLTQDELKTSQCKVYSRERYIDVIAEKFFDSKESYRESMKLIAAGKSYRELVSRFRDQSQLFRELLPPPDESGYRDIQRSLLDIEKAQGSLDDEKTKLTVLGELEVELGDAVKLRERVARMAYIAADYRLQEARQVLDTQQSAHSGAVKNLADNGLQLETHIRELNRLESRLETLKNSDIYKSQQASIQLGRELRRNDQGTQEVETRLAAHRQDLAQLQARTTLIWQSIEDFWQNLASHFEDFQHLFADYQPDDDRRQQAYNERFQILQNRLIKRRDEVVADMAGLVHQKKESEKQMAVLARQISLMEKQREAVPAVTRFAELEARLQAEKINFVPLFRTIEPAADMPAALGRVIEELLGSQRLCTILVADSQIKKARAEVIAEAYDLAVVDCVAPDILPAPLGGLRRFVAFHGDMAIAAENYVAGIIDKFSYIAAEDAFWRHKAENLVSGNGLVREHGSLRRVDATAIRFLGANAREATARELIADLAGQQHALELDLRDLSEELTAARAEHSRLVRALDSVNGVSPKIFANFQQNYFELEERQNSINARLQNDEGILRQLTLEREDLQTKIKTIEELTDSSQGQEVAAEVELLLRQKKSCEELAGECRRNGGRFEAMISNYLSRIEQQELFVEDRQEIFKERQAQLLGLLGDIDETNLQQNVYVTNRGQQIKPENSEVRWREAEAALIGQNQKITSHLLHDTCLQRDYRFEFNEAALTIKQANGILLGDIRAELQQHYDEAALLLEKKNQALFEDLIFKDIVRRLYVEEQSLHQTIKSMNGFLRELRFGNTVYAFKMQLRDEFKEFRELIHKVSDTDPQTREKLRDYFGAHRNVLVREGHCLPDFLDYRKWHDVVLQASTGGKDGVVLTRSRLCMGSGGEQSVPNYILLLSLAKVHLDHTKSSIRLILMDEAFYGIDPQRRDELLSFADHLDLCLIVAHPELDGVTEALGNTTTLLVEKTQEGDIYLGKCDYSRKIPQNLFSAPEIEPEAIIRVDGGVV